MNEFETKLINFLDKENIEAEHLLFEQTCHSVEDAAKAAGTEPENVIKSICMVDGEDNLIVGIVNGTDRVDTEKVKKELELDKLQIAKPDEILKRTGFPVGGVPAVGYQADFIIDSKIMEKQVVYMGGGSANSLLKILTEKLQKANGGIVAEIRK